MRGQTLQCLCLALRRRNHRWRVASKAADAGIVHVCAEELPASLRAGRQRHRLRCIQKTHEDCEHLPVRQNMEWIIKALIAYVCGIVSEDIVRLALVRRASRRFVSSLRGT